MQSQDDQISMNYIRFQDEKQSEIHFKSIKPENSEQSSLLNASSKKIDDSKTEGKQSPCSIVLNIIQGAVGAGIFGLPYTYKQSGLIVGITITIITGLLFRFYTYLLMVNVFNTSSKTYTQMVQRVLGDRAKLIFNYLSLIYQFGICLAYQILISRYISEAVKQLYPSIDENHFRIYVILVVIVLTYPFKLQRNLDKISFIGAIGFILFMYILILIICETPEYMNSENYKNLHFLAADFDINLIICFAIHVFAYCCQTFIVEVTMQVEQPSMQKVNKIHNITLVILVIIYLIIAILGYLSQLNQTPTILIYRTSPTGSADYFMIFAQISMAIFVFFANIVNGISAKNALNAVIWPNETYVSTKANFISSSTILIIPGILAILVPSVLSVFTILGGYLSISVAILFPGLGYIYSNKDSNSKIHTIVVSILTAFFTTVSMMAATVEILSSSGIIHIKSK